MGVLFGKFFTHPLITYDPKQWSKRLGEKCDKCEKNLTHEKCISLCKCYYFAHEQCFKNEFQGQIFSEDSQVRCGECKSLLRMQFRHSFKYGPNLTRWKLLKLSINLLFFLLTVIAILVTLNSNIKIQYAFFILYAQGVILSINLYFFVLCIRDIFYRKVVKINQIVSTKLDILTSAFKDIQMDTNEQLTKDCLFTEKK